MKVVNNSGEYNESKGFADPGNTTETSDSHEDSNNVNTVPKPLQEYKFNILSFGLGDAAEFSMWVVVAVCAFYEMIGVYKALK